MGDQRRAGFFTDPVDDVENTLRNSGFLHDLGQEAGRQRAELSGLQHDSATGGETRRELPRGEHERDVPRRDETGHAPRAPDRVSDLGVGAEGVFVDRSADVGEEPEVLGRPGSRARGPG